MDIRLAHISDPRYNQRMKIQRIEFDDLAQADAAHAEFPFCGACSADNKVQIIDGRFLLLCTRRPAAHAWHGGIDTVKGKSDKEIARAKKG